MLGRGGAGKSVLSRSLGVAAGLPVVELDAHFWQSGTTALPPNRWRVVQQQLANGDRWILDGDLGRFDIAEVRLAVADTIVVLDFPLWLCAWRAVRRSRENLAFWHWVVGYRRHSLPLIMATISDYAPGAAVHLLRSSRDVESFIAGLRVQGAT
ncbi:adenylate kinase [Nocardia sp. NBC_00511]|uniref:adenylate kinase n=1 Tax=Nocardia sp. NBC_00511 TaxID=2903591 RepID=UPI0030E56144